MIVLCYILIKVLDFKVEQAAVFKKISFIRYLCKYEHFFYSKCRREGPRENTLMLSGRHIQVI